ncbi:hypothetical protein C6A85_000000113135 [Mycobacterium sp. ITM-2017-0098]|nr:hypothetical protein C6A85_000000113135 [Mycobacterium sp. ITM-2017-0098]
MIGDHVAQVRAAEDEAGGHGRTVTERADTVATIVAALWMAAALGITAAGMAGAVRPVGVGTVRAHL